MRSSLPRWTESKVMRRLVGMLARRGCSQGMAVGVVTDALAVEQDRRKVWPATAAAVSAEERSSKADEQDNEHAGNPDGQR